MVTIPTIITGPASLRTVNSGNVSLATDGGSGGGTPPVDPDLYLRPAPNAGDKYIQPITGNLYKRPGSP